MMTTPATPDTTANDCREFDADLLVAVRRVLEARTSELRDGELPKLFSECSEKNQEWLEENSLHEPGTTERYAWTAGYAAALSDILQMLDRNKSRG